MKKLLLILSIVSGVSLVAVCQAGPSITVEKAWVREAPPGARVLAAYMMIVNNTPAATRLIAARSNCCDSIEMHESVMHDGVMSMTRHDSIELPASGNIDFRPGGLHLMLFGPKKALHAGDKIDLQLEFNGLPVITVTAEVRRQTGMDGHQHMHNH